MTEIEDVVGIAMPAMTTQSPTYARATWIGALDDRAFSLGDQRLPDLTGYAFARVLVRTGRVPRGFLEVPVVAGAVDHAGLIDCIGALPAVPPRGMPDACPPVSVLVCTFDRPGLLDQSLRELLELDYPEFEIVVVDNHPQSGLTRPVVEAIADSRLRLIEEPARGLARARNTGAMAARHRLIAFVDDDVVVDRWWLQGIVDGFAVGDQVACVSGLVPTGEIASAAQDYFDRRVSWARNLQRDVFSLDRPRPAEPLFPFQVGRYGTGANFAVDLDVLVGIGGFDEGLGVGSLTGGGEDIDLFMRVLLAGHQLVYEPSAIVWHRHRADLSGLRTQIANYGLGLGAFLTKLVLHPRTLAMMIGRAPAGIRHLAKVTRVQGPDDLAQVYRTLSAVERDAVLAGPLALARARLSGARKRPLRRQAAALRADSRYRSETQ